MELSKTSVCQEMDLNFEKKMPPFNGEKKKSHGLTYVDKQLMRLKRSNFSGRLLSVLGNRAASIFMYLCSPSSPSSPN